MKAGFGRMVFVIRHYFEDAFKEKVSGKFDSFVETVYAYQELDACPTEAIKFGEESELSHLISQAEVWQSEFGVKPRVYYLNLPKRFVAGTVYDPSQKEVVIGATCTLMDSDSRARFTATTDGFGDFWFEGLKVGTFSLKIAKNGKTKTIDLISTEKDVNLGDIPLA